MILCPSGFKKFAKNIIRLCSDIDQSINRHNRMSRLIIRFYAGKEQSQVYISFFFIITIFIY